MIDAENLTDRTLEQALESATRFVLGVNSLPVVRAILKPRGLTDAEIDRASALIQEVLAIRLPPTQALFTAESKAQREAVVWLDNWDEPSFREVAAILSNGFSSTRDWLFDNLTAGAGADAVLAARTFCHRYQQLQSGSAPGREAHAADDAAALARLAERGYGPDAIAEVQSQLAVAFGPTPELVADADAASLAATRRQKLVELKKWYDEWATTARNYVKRKSYLITLGLASRRVRKPKAVAPPSSAPSSTPSSTPIGTPTSTE